MPGGHTIRQAKKPKRQSIRAFMWDSTGPATLLGRHGFGRDVRFLLQKAYRIGLNNGKLLRSRTDDEVTRDKA